MCVCVCVSGQGEEWANGLRSGDYELLCRDGTRARVTEFQRCHLVRVPSRGIAVGNDVDPDQVYNMLMEGQVGLSANTMCVYVSVCVSVSVFVSLYVCVEGQVGLSANMICFSVCMCGGSGGS